VASWPCPFLRGDVEMTDERRAHILERHPELTGWLDRLLPAVLADPDEVRRSRHFAAASLFSRWEYALRGGKHVVVVVVQDEDAGSRRRWIITAYVSNKLVEGTRIWTRA